MPRNGKEGMGTMDNITFNFSNLAQKSADKIIYKEVLFLPYDIEIFTIMLMSLLLAWLFHEAMHYIKANSYKLQPSYGWDKKGSFVKIGIKPDPEQEKRIIEAGVIMGMLPIIFTTLFIGLWSIIPLMLYILGCNSDIKKLIKKGDDKKWE